MIFNDKYRAHFQENGYAYDHGSWNRIASMPYVDLEFGTTSLRATEGFFHTMRNSSPRPDGSRASATASLRRILSEKSVADLLDAFSEKIAGAYSWSQESEMLCASMFKNFAEPGRDRVFLSNFAKWASRPMAERQEGVNFDNCFYRISAAEVMSGAMQRVRTKNSP